MQSVVFIYFLIYVTTFNNRNNNVIKYKINNIKTVFI